MSKRKDFNKFLNQEEQSILKKKSSDISYPEFVKELSTDLNIPIEELSQQLRVQDPFYLAKHGSNGSHG